MKRDILKLSVKKQVVNCIILLCAVSYAYSQDLKVVNIDGKGCTGEFPFIISNSNPLASEKINTYLNVDLLEIVPGSFKKCPFEKVMYDSANCCAHTDFENYSININSKTILSISINGETTGAYSENANWNYNFNAITGDLIYPDELFTEAGYSKIKKQLISKRKAIVTEFLKGLNAQFISKKFEIDEERANDQKSIYEDCLQYIDDNDFIYGQFLIHKNFIVFTRERCSNHGMRAVDDLGEFSDTLKISEISNLLSRYGKALLFVDTKECQNIKPPISNTKILKGFINDKIPITCIFYRPYDDRSISIKYWYDKNKSVIEWRGTFRNKSKLNLIEDDYFDKKQDKWILKALINADVTADSIKGTWTNQKNGKKLTICLNRY